MEGLNVPVNGLPFRQQVTAKSNRSFPVNITNEERGIIPFCVPGPALEKAAYCVKLPKTRDLALLANQVQERL